MTAYREKLSYLVDFLGGDTQVEHITAGDLRRYIVSLMDQGTLYANHPTHQERKGSLSEFTIAGRKRAVKRLFRWLMLEGVLEVNPAERIEVKQPKREEPKGITEADFSALLATTEGDGLADRRDRAIILLLGDSGVRVGGLCGLRVHDLDLDARRARVTEKGDKTRTVFFGEHTAEALRAWLEVHPDVGNWLFVRLSSHKPGALSPNGVTQMLRRRAKQAGVTGPCNPHAFRHAYARFFLLDGGNLGVLSDLMGHSDPSVTKRWYGVFALDELQEKHQEHSMVERMLGGGKNED